MAKKIKNNRGRSWILKMIGVALVVAVVFQTAPTIATFLGSVATTSANLSFSPQLKTGQMIQAQNANNKNINHGEFMDDVPINQEAGLMDDPELAQEFLPLDQQGDAAGEKIPKKPNDAGKIQRKTLSAGNTSSFIPIGNTYLKNSTNSSREEIQHIAKQAMPFQLKKTKEPQVLIYHTHATESFQPYATDWYDKNYNARSTNNDKNMVAVGKVLKEQLDQAGIYAIHLTEQYDLSYMGAYDRSRVDVEKVLKKYPSIQVVLDLHRDAIGKDPVTAPVVKIKDEVAAQVMIIACQGTKSQAVPNYKKNLAFATHLQQQIQADFPQLMRPLLFGARFYNQDLSVGALLIEVGGHGNTLEEAKRAISYTASSLIKLLQKNTQ